MLKPAQLYKEELELKSIEAWYDPKNIYWNHNGGDCIITLDDNNYERHQFVSIDKDDNIIGFICYSVDWAVMSCNNFGIISFEKGNLEFVKDLYQAICDIFEKYHMNRLSWYCFADNPAIKGYRRFIKNHGGIENGYYRQNHKLADGQLHDSVTFEILATEFHR